MDAEQGLLGALLYDNKSYDRITEKLLAQHFYIPAHQRIFQAIVDRLEKGQSASPTILKLQFDEDDALRDVGGAGYLAELVGGVITLVNNNDYAQQIRDLYLRRNLIKAADEIQVMAKDPTTKNILPEVERVITAITNDVPIKQSSAGNAAIAALQWTEEMAQGRISPTKTLIPDIDAKISGFYPGRLYVVGARPGMGKTAFALSLADNIAKTRPCLFVSLEMKPEELSMRLISARTGITVDQQQNPVDLMPEDWRALEQAVRDIQKLRLEILDAAGADLSAIKLAARRHRRMHGEFVLFIDYLGLMALDKKIGNKVHQIEEITTGLKTLSKEINIPIVLLCQLSRALESRDDKRPMPSDLRDSGAIEQDADAIMFIHREEVYMERTELVQGDKEKDEKFHKRKLDYEINRQNAKGKAEIIIAKNRQGRRGIVRLNFDGDRQRFDQ